jgi:predicted PurR-regulated permease PerM
MQASVELRTFRREIVFAFSLALALYLGWILREVLVLIYVSALFAVVLSPFVSPTTSLHFGRKRLFKGSALFFLLIGSVAAVVGFGFLALPPVISDLQTLGGQMPTRLPAILQSLRNMPLEQGLETPAFKSQVQGFASNAATYLLFSVRDWAGKVFDVVMGAILTVYFLLEGSHAYQWFLSLFPTGSRQRLDKTLQRAKVRMGKWLLGQGAIMLTFAVVSTVVFLCLHVRYAYALGVLTGLLNIIPVVGLVISIALALAVAAIDSWGRVLGVAIFFVVYVEIENSFIVPRIMKHRVHLPAVAILVALLLGSALAGIVGAMVAIPTAVLVSELMEEYLVKKEPA